MVIALSLAVVGTDDRPKNLSGLFTVVAGLELTGRAEVNVGRANHERVIRNVVVRVVRIHTPTVEPRTIERPAHAADDN